MKKTLLCAALLGLFCATTSLHATMFDDVRAMLGQARMLSQQGNGQVLGASISPQVALHTKMLSIGLKNDPDVRKIQASLNQLGYLTITPDGNYGPQTAAAVTRFQSINGLDATGVVDPETKAVINQGALPTIAPAAPAATFDVSTIIKGMTQQIAGLQKMVDNPDILKAALSNKTVATLCIVVYTSSGPHYFEIASNGYPGDPVFVINSNTCLPNTNNAVNLQALVGGV